MRTVLTNVVDTKEPGLVSKVNSFSTSGLNLQIDWDHNIKEIVVISNQIPENLETTLCSLIDKNYTITVFPEFTTTWLSQSETYVINNYPDPKVDTSFLNNIRNMNHNLSSKELVRVLSHALVWDYCVKVQKPVIVVEAGSVPTKLLEVHIPRNSIINLSSVSLKQINQNWHSFQGLESYAIDQFIAKQLLSYLYAQGIRDNITTMIRDDLFCICEI